MAAWREEVENLPLETRIEALLEALPEIEPASDRAAGQPSEVAAQTLHATAVAEDNDRTHRRIEVAAAESTAGSLPGPRQEDPR